MTRTRTIATMLALLISTTAPLAADTAPTPASPAEYAAAALRQDVTAGIYEVLDAPELGVLFVASTPSFDKGKPGAVHALDRNDLSLKRTIQLPRRAFALGMDHQTGRLYVGNTLDGALTVIDAKSGVPVGLIQLGKPQEKGFEHTRMIEVDQKTGHVFVSGPSDTGTVWVVDGRKGELLTRIDNAGKWAAGLAQDPDNGRVYVSGGGVQEIGIIDSQNNTRIDSIATGDTAKDGDEESAHFFVNLAIDPKGQRLFAADANSGQLYVFDLSTGKVTGTVATGKGTLDVNYNPARAEIYVTRRGVTREDPTGSGGLMVLDADSLAVKRDLSLPVHPNTVETSADGKTLFVSVKAPHSDKHPAFYEDAIDSVMRFDLAQLISGN